MILKNRAACYLKLVSTGDMFCPETLFRVKTLPNDDDYEGGVKGTGEQGGPSFLLPIPCMATAAPFS